MGMKIVCAFLVALFMGGYVGYVQQHHHPKHHHVKVAKKRHHKVWVAYDKGQASWYGCDKHLQAEGLCPWGTDGTQGNPTSSRIKFNTYFPMCASWHFKFHTWVIVENLKTHKSTACEILDRGPGKSTGRPIDLSYYVKHAIGMAGLGKVVVYAKNGIKPYHMTAIEREVYENS